MRFKKLLKYFAMVIITPFAIMPILFYILNIAVFVFGILLQNSFFANFPLLRIEMSGEISLETYITWCVYILAMVVAGILSYQLYRLTYIELSTRKKKKWLSYI